MMELGATGDMDLRIVIATVLIVRLTPARMGSRLLPKGKMQCVIHKEQVLINFVLLFINQIIIYQFQFLTLRLIKLKSLNSQIIF